MRLSIGSIKQAASDDFNIPVKIARDLAKHMYEYVELNGTGRWLRDETGTWVLKKFKIESFKVLKTTDLEEVFRQLREVHKSSGWAKMDDPLKFLRDLRDEDESE